jgi:hypothetical protein
MKNDKWTIFVTIFGGQEMLADFCENICVFVKIYREHLRESMGKTKCVEGPKMSYLREIM